MSDYHDGHALLVVMEIPNELALKVLFVPRLQVALHLDHKPLWGLPLSFLHQNLHLAV